MLFTIVSNGAIDTAQIAVLDLQRGTQTVLIRGGSHAHYVSSGHLVYAAGSSLRAVAFDSDRLEVIGTPTPVVPEIATTADGGANFEVALNGTLVYVPRTGAALARALTWVGSANAREAPIRAPARSYTYPH